MTKGKNPFAQAASLASGQAGSVELDKDFILGSRSNETATAVQQQNDAPEVAPVQQEVQVQTAPVQTEVAVPTPIKRRFRWDKLDDTRRKNENGFPFRFTDRERAIFDFLAKQTGESKQALLQGVIRGFLFDKLSELTNIEVEEDLNKKDISQVLDEILEDE